MLLIAKAHLCSATIGNLLNLLFFHDHWWSTLLIIEEHGVAITVGDTFNKTLGTWAHCLKPADTISAKEKAKNGGYGQAMDVNACSDPSSLFIKPRRVMGPSTKGGSATFLIRQRSRMFESNCAGFMYPTPRFRNVT